VAQRSAEDAAGSRRVRQLNQALDLPTSDDTGEAFSGVVNVVSLEEEMVWRLPRKSQESLKPRPPE